MNPLVLFAYELLTFEMLNNESIKQYVCCASAMSSRIITYAFELVSALIVPKNGIF